MSAVSLSNARRGALLYVGWMVGSRAALNVLDEMEKEKKIDAERHAELSSRVKFLQAVVEAAYGPAGGARGDPGAEEAAAVSAYEDSVSALGDAIAAEGAKEPTAGEKAMGFLAAAVFTLSGSAVASLGGSPGSALAAAEKRVKKAGDRIADLLDGPKTEEKREGDEDGGAGEGGGAAGGGGKREKKKGPVKVEDVRDRIRGVWVKVSQASLEDGAEPADRLMAMGLKMAEGTVLLVADVAASWADDSLARRERTWSGFFRRGGPRVAAADCDAALKECCGMCEEALSTLQAAMGLRHQVLSARVLESMPEDLKAAEKARAALVAEQKRLREEQTRLADAIAAGPTGDDLARLQLELQGAREAAQRLERSQAAEDERARERFEAVQRKLKDLNDDVIDSQRQVLLRLSEAETAAKEDRAQRAGELADAVSAAGAAVEDSIRKRLDDGELRAESARKRDMDEHTWQRRGLRDALSAQMAAEAKTLTDGLSAVGADLSAAREEAVQGLRRVLAQLESLDERLNDMLAVPRPTIPALIRSGLWKGAISLGDEELSEAGKSLSPAKWALTTRAGGLLVPLDTIESLVKPRNLTLHIDAAASVNVIVTADAEDGTPSWTPVESVSFADVVLGTRPVRVRPYATSREAAFLAGHMSVTFQLPRENSLAVALLARAGEWAASRDAVEAWIWARHRAGCARARLVPGAEGEDAVVLVECDLEPFRVPVTLDWRNVAPLWFLSVLKRKYSKKRAHFLFAEADRAAPRGGAGRGGGRAGGDDDGEEEEEEMAGIEVGKLRPVVVSTGGAPVVKSARTGGAAGGDGTEGEPDEETTGAEEPVTLPELLQIPPKLAGVRPAGRVHKRHVVVRGDPGMGKTTWVDWISYLWAELLELDWEAAEIEWFVVFHARNLLSELKKEKPREKDMWAAEYGKDLRMAIEAVTTAKVDAHHLFSLLVQHLNRIPERVQYVFDGYDEVANYEDADKFLNLLRRGLRVGGVEVARPRPRVIVTSRPMPVGGFDSLEGAQFQLKGLDRESQTAYIAEYGRIRGFAELDAAIRQLGSHERSFRELLPNPVMLEVICFVLSDETARAELLGSDSGGEGSDSTPAFQITPIFEWAVDLLLKRWVDKYWDYSAEERARLNTQLKEARRALGTFPRAKAIHLLQEMIAERVWSTGARSLNGEQLGEVREAFAKAFREEACLLFGSADPTADPTNREKKRAYHDVGLLATVIHPSGWDGNPEHKDATSEYRHNTLGEYMWAAWMAKRAEQAIRGKGGADVQTASSVAWVPAAPGAFWAVVFGATGTRCALLLADMGLGEAVPEGEARGLMQSYRWPFLVQKLFAEAKKLEKRGAPDDAEVAKSLRVFASVLIRRLSDVGLKRLGHGDTSVQAHGLWVRMLREVPPEELTLELVKECSSVVDVKAALLAAARAQFEKLIRLLVEANPSVDVTSLVIPALEQDWYRGKAAFVKWLEEELGKRGKSLTGSLPGRSSIAEEFCGEDSRVSCLVLAGLEGPDGLVGREEALAARTRGSDLEPVSRLETLCWLRWGELEGGGGDGEGPVWWEPLQPVKEVKCLEVAALVRMLAVRGCPVRTIREVDIRGIQSTISWLLTFISPSHPGVGLAGVVAGFPSLHKLILRGTSIGAAGASALVGGLSGLSSLRELGLSENWIGDAGASALASELSGLSSLEWLHLWSNSIGDAGASALAGGLSGLSSLRGVNLSWNSVGDAGASALASELSGLSSLRELHLDRNSIGDAGASALAGGLSGLSSLERLALGWNSIGAAGATDLAGDLSGLSSLRVLHLSWNSIGDAGASAMASELSGLSSLRELHLDRNSIGATGVSALAGGLSGLSSLRKLNLSGNSIGAAGASALAGGLSGLSSLRKLNLSGNSIGDAGASALAGGLSGLSSLRELWLSGNSIGDAGASALAGGLSGLSSLHELRLWGNSIGDAGASALAGGLSGLSSLEVLDLDENSIGDAGASALAGGLSGLSSLRELRLWGNSIGDAGASALRGTLSGISSLRIYGLPN